MRFVESAATQDATAPQFDALDLPSTRSNSHRLEIIIIALIVIEIVLELFPHGAIPTATLRVLRRFALPIA